VAPLSNEQFIKESGCLILQPQAGDKLLLRLNTCGKPIANKYCEEKKLTRMASVMANEAAGAQDGNHRAAYGEL